MKIKKISALVLSLMLVFAMSISAFAASKDDIISKLQSAGVAKRAPDIFIKLGLEWFYRLLKQPSRIGRMMKLPKFLLIVIKERLFGRKGK